MDQQRSNDAAGGQLTCSTLSLMVPTLRLLSAFAWQVVQHCNVVHYGKVEELLQLVTEVVPHLLSDTEKVHLLLGLRATPAPSGPCHGADLQTLVWEFISRLDKLLPLPDIKQTAELLSTAPSLLEECGQLEFEPAQLKILLDHHTQQDNAIECSLVQSQGTIPSTASSQSKPQQNCTNRKRCRRSGRKLSPQEDKDRQSDHSLDEEEGAEGKQSDEEWLPPWNDHSIEEEEGAEGKQSNEEWLLENCSPIQVKADPAALMTQAEPSSCSHVAIADGCGHPGGCEETFYKNRMKRRFEDALCELVRNHVHLYDATSPLHNRKDICQKSWNEICSTLKSSAIVCKNKWVYLRSKFVKAHGGKSGRSPPVLERLQRLAWLKPYISHRSVTNVPNDDDMKAELLSSSSSPLEFEPAQLEKPLDHHTQQGPTKECPIQVEADPAALMTQAEPSTHSHVATVDGCCHPGGCEETFSKRNMERRLCELVRKHVHLYDTTSPLRLPHVLEQSWNEIGRTLQLSAKECKNKWAYIRSSFVKALRNKKQKAIIQRLAWVKPYISHRSSVTNVPNDDDRKAELLSDSSSVLEFEPSQLEKPLDHHTQQGHAKESSSSQSKPQQNCSNRKRWRRTGRKLSPHRTEKDKDRQSDHSIEEVEQSDEEWLPENCSPIQVEADPAALMTQAEPSSHSQVTTATAASSPQSKPQQNCSNRKRWRRSGRKLSPHRTEEDKDRQSDHSLEEEEQSDEEWLPENCGSLVQSQGTIPSTASSHQSKPQQNFSNRKRSRSSGRQLSRNGVKRAHVTTMARPIHKCSICGIGFSRQRMFNHMRTHTRPFSCEDCGKRYPSKTELVVHRRGHTGERPFVCTHCGRGFRNAQAMQSHVLTHTGERPYMCHICGKKSIQPNTHKRHMLMHKGEKNYLCTECGKAFLTKGELGKHTMWHTGERPHACKLCGKRFSQSTGLTLHMRTHTREKPYVCTHCPKSFSSASARGRHMYVHSEKKPHECSACGKGFIQTWNLRIHKRTCKGRK